MKIFNKLEIYTLYKIKDMYISRSGQQLINFGLAHLKEIGVELVFTYGDMNFYSKVGFKQTLLNFVWQNVVLSRLCWENLVLSKVCWAKDGS